MKPGGGCNHFDIRWNHGQPELAPSTELDSQPGLQQWSPAIAHSIMRFIISYIISYIIRTILSYNISICLIPHYIQQCSHPSKFLEICNNVSPNPIRQKSQEFVWITTIMFGKIRLSLFGVENHEPYEKWFLTCLYRSQDFSPLYLLLVQAPDFKSRWCARKILF